MAQAWQAEIHDKKSQNNSLRQKAKKYILHLACLYCSGFSELLDLEQRLFHAGLLLFKMAQFHFTHSKKF